MAPDDELWQRFFQHPDDTDAFAEIVRRTERWLWSYSFSLLNNADDAHDVVQEIHVTLWNSRRRLTPGNVLGWLKTVCWSKCIDILRKRRGFQSLSSKDDSQGDIDPPDPDVPTGLENIEQEEQREILTACVDRLPEKWRECIRMFYWERLSYEEIATRLAMSLNTVRSHIHRAKIELVQCLQQRLGGRR